LAIDERGLSIHVALLSGVDPVHADHLVTSQVDRLDKGSALTKDLMKLRTSEQHLASNVPAAPSAESVRIGWIVAGRVRVR